MKKSYSKKQLAMLIIEANPSIFIPTDVLMDDLDCIYKIRKYAKKILSNRPYDVQLIENMVTISKNIFENKITILYNMVMSDEELEAIERVLKRKI